MRDLVAGCGPVRGSADVADRLGHALAERCDAHRADERSELARVDRLREGKWRSLESDPACGFGHDALDLGNHLLDRQRRPRDVDDGCTYERRTGSGDECRGGVGGELHLTATAERDRVV